MRNRHYRLGLVLALVAAALMAVLLAACGSSGSSSSSTATTGPITIGEMNSLTGDSAAPAKTLQQGFELEVAAINAAGGVNGRQLKVITLDDKSDVTSAVQDTTQLIQQDKVSAIIGPFPDTSEVAARSIAEKFGVPMMLYAPPNLADLANKSYKWSFLCTAGPDALANAYLKAAQDKGWKTVVAIGDVIPIHQETLKLLKQQAPGAGIKLIVLNDSWQLSATDLSPIVAKIAAADKANKPDGNFLLSNPIHVPVLQKGLKALGVTTPEIGSPAGTSPAIFLQGPPAVQGFQTLGAGITNPAQLPASYPGKAAMLAFVAQYTAKYKQPPDFYAGFGYDAINLLVNAMKKAGGDDKAKVRAALESTTNWAGCQGVFTYTPTDHVGIHGGLNLWQVKGTSFNLIETLNPNGIVPLK
jgi:branched-chain amino acid transport system substrate-binding protein